MRTCITRTSHPEERSQNSRVSVDQGQGCPLLCPPSSFLFRALISAAEGGVVVGSGGVSMNIHSTSLQVHTHPQTISPLSTHAHIFDPLDSLCALLPVEKYIVILLGRNTSGWRNDEVGNCHR
jgi:hypothetical protein